MISSTKKNRLGIALLAFTCAAGIAACDDSDDTAPGDSGVKADSGVKTDSGTSLDAGTAADSGTVADSGTAADAAVKTDSGAAGDSGAATDAGTALDLYDRLGGKAGLEKFVGDVVTMKVLTDADLKTFFFNQVASPIPAGHPSPTQIVVCFGRLIGNALSRDVYPGAPVVDAANTNTPNFTCRGMAESHTMGSSMLHIGSGTFDKFVNAIATSLAPLVKPTATQVGEITQTEYNALAGALVAQKPVITTPGANAAAGPYPN